MQAMVFCLMTLWMGIWHLVLNPARVLECSLKTLLLPIPLLLYMDLTQGLVMVCMAIQQVVQVQILFIHLVCMVIMGLMAMAPAVIAIMVLVCLATLPTM